MSDELYRYVRDRARGGGTSCMPLRVLSEARSRGIIGGLIYDALHAETARRLQAEKIFTYNVSNFEHVAPDLVILEP